MSDNELVRSDSLVANVFMQLPVHYDGFHGSVTDIFGEAIK